MDNISQKRCSKCREYQGRENFYNNKRVKDGLNGQCKTCTKAYWQIPHVKARANNLKKEWMRRQPYDKAVRRDINLKKNYGITQVQYDEMYQSQNGKCRICQKPHEKLFVDHNHKKDKVRGLLCHYCNLMIGHAFENPETLRSGITYLETYAN